MMDIVQLALAIIAGSTIVFGTIAIWIMMGYYSIRMFQSFHGGILSRGWKYVCIAIPFLIVGQLATGFGDSASVTNLFREEVVKAVGVSLSALGGLMLVIGLREQYKAWHPKEMKEMKQDAAPEELPRAS
jgi:hypothetical protein